MTAIESFHKLNYFVHPEIVVKAIYSLAMPAWFQVKAVTWCKQPHSDDLRLSLTGSTTIKWRTTPVCQKNAVSYLETANYRTEKTAEGLVCISSQISILPLNC